MSYSKRFDQALVFASKIHRDQTRKGSQTPYITHLMAVSAMVGAHGGDEDQVIAALLHDAVEDCIGEIPDIRARIERKFGERVLRIVEGCTDADTEPKPPWRPRKESYLTHLREEPTDSPVLLVSLSDKVHNAQSIVRDLRVHGDEIWLWFAGRKVGSMWYYSSLAEIFSEKKPGWLADELARLVGVMEDLSE